jgi:hypothetical protein
MYRVLPEHTVPGPAASRMMRWGQARPRPAVSTRPGSRSRRSSGRAKRPRLGSIGNACMAGHAGRSIDLLDAMLKWRSPTLCLHIISQAITNLLQYTNGGCWGHKKFKSLMYFVRKMS